ncbi:MAG: NnrS family protein [Deltaproteobacteria bacterium]|nr:NnrS family protein [Deltaproteobacteria bacterium]
MLPLLAAPFRPFFWLAGLQAVISVPVYLTVLSGKTSLSSATSPFVWHAHEMLYGYCAAVLAGFLLTATRAWTQRQTVGPLGTLLLVAIWLGARVISYFPAPARLSWVAAADATLLCGTALAIARPILLARSWRNASFAPLLLLLAAANPFFPANRLIGSATPTLPAVEIVIMIMVIFAGRIIPLFTRNALSAIEVRQRDRRDDLALAANAAMLVPALFVVSPTVDRALSALAGTSNLLRMVGWRSIACRRDALLLVLHLGYAWIVVAQLLRAWLGNDVAGRAIWLHAATLGAIGTLTLAMLARVSLGHTGRPLRAGRLMTLAFACLLGAVLARISIPTAVRCGADPHWLLTSYWTATGLWSVAFALYLLRYTPMLFSPRVDGKTG